MSLRDKRWSSWNTKPSTYQLPAVVYGPITLSDCIYSPIMLAENLDVVFTGAFDVWKISKQVVVLFLKFDCHEYIMTSQLFFCHCADEVLAIVSRNKYSHGQGIVYLRGVSAHYKKLRWLGVYDNNSVGMIAVVGCFLLKATAASPNHLHLLQLRRR